MQREGSPIRRRQETPLSHIFSPLSPPIYQSSFINHHSNIAVIIPAHNEESSIGLVLRAIPSGLVREVVVADNASSDRTGEVARRHGATVVEQPLRGYGNACLKAIEYLQNKPPGEQPDIVVFLDGDFSDYPEEMPELLRPIFEGGVDLVIGSRALGERQRGSMQPQQVFGNWLATNLIRLFFGYRFTDLGPFRAIRWDKLLALKMADKNYGWTVEMQVKAAKQKLKCVEVPVSYRRRVGVSKVSGTVKGSVLAGVKILWVIFKSLK
ncbi:MAG: glycosyltransferase family 2 protein [Bacteroidota bacterium]